MLLPFRDELANTSVALVLVLVIVAVAATGHRVAGLLAALSAAVWSGAASTTAPAWTIRGSSMTAAS